MMRYDTADCGPKSRNYLLTGTERNGLNVTSSKVCSERVKVGPRQRNRPSGAIPRRNYGVIMTKNFSKYQATEA